jgi:hypothetical protein
VQLLLIASVTEASTLKAVEALAGVMSGDLAVHEAEVIFDLSALIGDIYLLSAESKAKSAVLNAPDEWLQP